MNKLEYKNYLLCYISKEELVDRICNAIEYINKNIEDEYKYDGLLYFNKSKYELLEILGDKENE